MERRSFLKKAGAGLAVGAASAMPAIAADAPNIKWRLTSAFPKSLDTIYGGAETVAKRVAEATGGKFQIQVFAAGEIVPGGPAALDAVTSGSVEMCHTCSFYSVGKDPTFAFDTAVPFGMTNRQMDAWYRYGNGGKLMREFFAGHGLYNIPAGNTGVQMGGWYRKEIKKVADLQGLKMRIGGLAGQVLAKLGSVPQQIPGGDIYPSLEKGTIDAAEWIGPYDDQKLGFNKVAKYYYYPAWWEGGPQITTFISQKHWASLPKEYQAILELACADAHVEMMAQYDAKNPTALKQLVGAGTQLRPFPKEVLDACYKAANELYAEISAKNPAFKKVYDDFRKFQGDQNLWFRIAEGSYSNYMASAR
jgi:TRAP-type mannitol/chloroaromatic compound transport system substrate-binding protein